MAVINEDSNEIFESKLSKSWKLSKISPNSSKDPSQLKLILEEKDK